MKIKQKIYFKLILLAVIILILFFTAIQPLVAKIKQLSAEYREKDNLLISYQKKLVII